MKIKDVLQKAPEGAVLADQSNGVVRLWTLARPFVHHMRLKALQRWFPSLEVMGTFIRLGGFSSLAQAQAALADAKMGTTSRVVKELFQYDVTESLTTITRFS